MVHGQRVVVVIAAGAGMLGTFLPWASVGVLSIAGTGGDGWITLVMFGIAMAVACAGDRTAFLSEGLSGVLVAVAGLAALVGLYDASELVYLDFALVGGGVCLVIVAAAVIVVTASLG